MKKISMIASIALLFSGTANHAKIDLSEMNFSGAPTAVDSGSGGFGYGQQERGDGDRLFNALGIDPSIMKETVGTFWGTNTKISESNDPRMVQDGYKEDSDGNKGDPNYRQLTTAEISDKEANQKDRLVGAYFGEGSNNDVGLSKLKADIKALQDLHDITKNEKLKGRLNDLLHLTQDASSHFSSKVMNDKVNEAVAALQPSSGKSLSKSILEVRANMNDDPSNRVIHSNVLKQLEDIDKETMKFKRHSNDSLEDALEEAGKSLSSAETRLSRNGGNPQYKATVDLLNEVVAQLGLEFNEDKNSQLKEFEREQAVDAIVLEKIENHSHPSEALEAANAELLDLRGDLAKAKVARLKKSEISARENKVEQMEQIVGKLSTEVKAKEANERIVNKRVDDLLARYNGDSERALQDIKSKINPMGRPRSTNKVDLEIERELELRATNDRLVEEKRAGESLAVRGIVEGQLKSADNPIHALEVAEKKLSDLQENLQQLKAYRRPIREINEKNIEIGKQEQAITMLTVKAESARDENQRVERTVDALVRRNNSLAGKALEEAKNIATSSSGRSSHAFDTQVVTALGKRVKEEADYAKKNNPLDLAMANFRKANPSDYPKALEAVAAAVLGRAGVTLDRLSDAARQNIANVLQSTSSQLIVIMNDARMPDMVKQEKKQEVMKKMIFEVGSSASGISQENLASGNVQTIATEAAMNKLVDYLVPGGAGATSGGYNHDFGAAYVDPKEAAYLSLGVLPGASDREIRSAYIELSKKHHPDRNYGNPTATKKFQEVNEAYHLLVP